MPSCPLRSDFDINETYLKDFKNFLVLNLFGGCEFGFIKREASYSNSAGSEDSSSDCELGYDFSRGY
jgi:hypothetical protein